MERKYGVQLSEPTGIGGVNVFDRNGRRIGSIESASTISGFGSGEMEGKLKELLKASGIEVVILKPAVVGNGKLL